MQLYKQSLLRRTECVKRGRGGKEGREARRAQLMNRNLRTGGGAEHGGGGAVSPLLGSRGDGQMKAQVTLDHWGRRWTWRVLSDTSSKLLLQCTLMFFSHFSYFNPSFTILCSHHCAF